MPTVKSRKLGQLLTIHFKEPELTEEYRNLIEEHNVGGVILYRSNCESLWQMQDLIGSLRSLHMADPLFIAIDHEGGRVHRLPKPFTHFPAMSHLKSPEQAYLVGEAMGRELVALGIDIDFAPVLDVWTNPSNKVIGDRAFSNDFERVATLGCAFIRGLESMGVAACGKHFPGHGDTDSDSHFVLPNLPHNRRRLESVEWVPFQRVIEQGIASLMTAHIIYDILDAGVPATLSVKIIRDLLRTELGFNGVIFSDDLTMGAIREYASVEKACVMAIQAGCDNVLVCHHHGHYAELFTHLYRAVEKGEIAEEVISAAASRVAALKKQFVLPKKEIPVSVIGCLDHKSLAHSLV